MLALKFQRSIETAFTHLFLFFEQKSLRTLVLKNLVANRDRNKMTAIVYSLGLGFIIFLNIAQNTQIQTIRLHQAKYHVGYLELRIHDPFVQGAIKPKHIEPALREHKDIIEDHSWITSDLLYVPELKIRE